MLRGGVCIFLLLWRLVKTDRCVRFWNVYQMLKNVYVSRLTFTEIFIFHLTLISYNISWCWISYIISRIITLVASVEETKMTKPTLFTISKSYIIQSLSTFQCLHKQSANYTQSSECFKNKCTSQEERHIVSKRKNSASSDNSAWHLTGIPRDGENKLFNRESPELQRSSAV